MGVGTTTPTYRLDVAGTFRAATSTFSGNVGIATTTPSYKLDVQGTIQMTGFKMPTGAASDYVLTSNASGVGTWQAVSALPSGTTGQTLRHNGSTWTANSAIYNDGTNVGIGATSFGTSAQKVLGIGVGTKPASSPADMVQLYAEDVMAAIEPDPDTKLLLHGDGADGSTSFPDASASNHTVTANGNAQVDTAQKKFGTGSALLDGTGDYLSVPDSGDWDFGSGNFTIDFWVRFNLISGTMTFFHHGWMANDSITLNCTDTYIHFSVFTNGSSKIDFSGNWSPSVNTWYHIALVRGWGGNANDWAITVDGSSVGTTTDADAIGSYNDNFFIGVGLNTASNPVNFFNGWIDEFRVSKGIARWTSNFTPPYTTESKAELKVLDEEGNETQLSPHDPVTGEWIFDSYNIKTGKHFRVNMEKLVKTVENLSGVQLYLEEYLQP